MRPSVVALGLAACAAVDRGDRLALDEPPMARAPGERSGDFDLLTYNIAGLPLGLSASSPTHNIPRMGPLFARYDLVVVQEDFAFFRELALGTVQPFRSQPVDKGGLGDGLDHFSAMPLHRIERHAWTVCSGTVSRESDCLAAKGFAVAEMTLADGVVVDVYNVHFDAGDDARDVEARTAQVEQLVDTMARRSAAEPVIVAGDTNMGQGEATLSSLLERAGLHDTCATLDCPGRAEIDRVLYRSARGLALEPQSWAKDERFHDGDGRPLSDHPAIAVGFRWTAPADR